MYPVKDLHKHSLYGVWGNVKRRCRSPKNPSYKWYGARGIDMCDAWYNNSYVFITWCLNNGWKPGLELDRIDNDGDYIPSNCRFITHAENVKNCRKLRSTNISGTKGISWNIRSQRWHVYKGKKYIGSFKQLDKAELALGDEDETVTKSD